MSRALTGNRGFCLRTISRSFSSADLRSTLWPGSRPVLALVRRSSLRLLVTAAKSGKPNVAASRGSKDVKVLARAFRPVPVTVLTVSKGASRAADDLAGSSGGWRRLSTTHHCLLQEAAFMMQPRRQSIGCMRRHVVFRVLEEYAAKIRRYTAFSATELRTNPKKAGATHVAIDAEGRKMLQSLQPQVALLSEQTLLLPAIH